MDERADQDPRLEGIVRIGDVLLGKYRVERVIGIGGMGVVVAAVHLDLDQRFAIKILLPQAARNADVAARFVREGRAAARIRSEHVARVTDVGTLADGKPYMVMEFLEGEDLAHVLRKRGPLPVVEAVDYVLQACEAIAEAHSLHIVHRDIKPGNLFLTRRADGSPCTKVLDFGISKMHSAESLGGTPQDFQGTLPTLILGTPLYMSPEQIRSSRDVDARADIWALGVVLFELLTGITPFARATLPEVVIAVTTESSRTLRQTRSELPYELEAVVLRCLEKDPAKRYANLGELAAALQPFGPPHASISVARIIRTLGTSADAAPDAPSAGGTLRLEAALVTPPSSGAMTPAGVASPIPPNRPAALPAVLGAVIAVVVAVATTILVWRNAGDESTTTQVVTLPESPPTSASVVASVDSAPTIEPITGAIASTTVIIDAGILDADVQDAELPIRARAPIRTTATATVTPKPPTTGLFDERK